MRVSRHIDQQVSKQSINNPRRAVTGGQITEGDFQLIQSIRACLVDTWILTGRSDVHAGNKIRQRRMILPERHHAAQQVGTAQQRTVKHSRSADYDMTASAGSNMATVIVEFFSSQSVLTRFLKKQCVDRFEFVPCT